MRKFIVTVKLPKDLTHDPRNKVEGVCPVTRQHCTDTTGQHHSFLTEATDRGEIIEQYSTQGYHITRVEEVEVVSHGGDHLDFRGSVISGSFVGKVVHRP